jgi:hypothetical protein
MANKIQRDAESGDIIDVSIVVVAWNVRELLEDCLESVVSETKDVAFEIIYVDNGSSDGSVEMVEAKYPNVVLVKNDENKGFIRANNQGIEIAKGRYVLLLNSDTLVLDNAVDRVVSFADQHPEAAVIGGKVLNPDRTLQRSCFMFYSPINTLLSIMRLDKLLRKSRFFGRRRMTWSDFENIMEVDTVVGCFSLVRMKAIEQVGTMDEIYFTFGDDPDWCYRFWEAGWKVLYTPDPRIIHYGGQTTKKLADKFTLQLTGSMLIFVWKFRSTAQFYLARALFVFSFIVKVFGNVFAGLVNRDDRKTRMMAARTYLLGIRYLAFDWTGLLMNQDAVKQRIRDQKDVADNPRRIGKFYV